MMKTVDIFPLNDSPPAKESKKWKWMKSSENVKNHKKDPGILNRWIGKYQIFS